MKFTPTTPFSEKCKISKMGTNSITVKGSHHPQGTNSDVFRKFSTWSGLTLNKNELEPIYFI